MVLRRRRKVDRGEAQTGVWTTTEEIVAEETRGVPSVNEEALSKEYYLFLAPEQRLFRVLRWQGHAMIC